MSARSASQPSDDRAWLIAAAGGEGLAAGLRELWQYRRVFWFFARRSLEPLYARTHLGAAWLLIRTLGPLAVGSFVFGEVMNVPSGGVPYFIFFLTGQIPWNLFDGPLVRASRGIESNRQLVTKLYVPPIVLPVSYMTAGLVEPIILAGVFAASLLYYRQMDGVWYLGEELHLPAALASMAIVLWFAFSLSLFTSVWQARARDVRFALRYVVGFWMFLTPVIYPLSHVPAGIRWLAYLNPLTAPVETFKWAVLPGMEHSWPWLAYSAAVTLVLFLAGAWYFTRSVTGTMDRL